MKNRVILFQSLLANILCDARFVSKFAHGVHKVAIRPEFSTQSCCFTSGCFLKISLTVMLLMVRMISVALSLVTDWIKKWTWSWSWSVPISKNLISYRFSISKHISFRELSTFLLKTTLRYFAGQTKWYNNTLTLCDLYIFALAHSLKIHFSPQAAGN